LTLGVFGATEEIRRRAKSGEGESRKGEIGGFEEERETRTERYRLV